MCGEQKTRHHNPAFVKLLETVTGPCETGMFGDGQDMMRRTTPSMIGRTGMGLFAAVLLFAGEVQAQSSGDGISNLLGNIFSGQKSTTPAPPQAAPGPGGAVPPWSGEDGASGHPLMTASAIREAAANFDNCGSWT